MHALPSDVLEHVRPVVVAFIVAGTCFGVRKPTWSAVILAKLLALCLGASELIASERISIRYHGEYSPRDVSLRIRGLVAVRVHDPATLVAGMLIVAWAIWMAVTARDLLRRPFPGFIRDYFLLQARAATRRQRTVTEVKEGVRMKTLARNFDQLRLVVKVLRARRKQRRQREQRAADEARGYFPVQAAPDSWPQRFQENGARGEHSAPSSSWMQSGLRSSLRSASASAG